MKSSVPILALSVSFLGYAALCAQSNPKVVKKVSFDRDITPILGQRCFKCHGPDATKAAAGLRLDLPDEVIKLRGKTPAIAPGNPDGSLVMNRITSENPAMRMPPSDSGVKPLSNEQIDLIRTWIQQGAQYEKHWSYVAPRQQIVPKVSNPAWCRTVIDPFVLTKLDQEHLKPEPEADRDSLALRAAETLTGLPPTPAELDQFRRDSSPKAYEKYVDRLLAKPAYGEHQARYWLDAVRYADTHGLQLDNERGFFPYRDWVVRAFNNDLPFDQFTVDQIAGDLLPHPTTEQLIATGYVRANLTSNEGGAIPEEFLARNTFDRVDTTSTVFLGLTMGCAKCHDHKYDPIKQKDYYSLYAFFNSTKDKPLDDNILLPAPVIRAATPEQEARLKQLNQALMATTAAINTPQAANWLSTRHQASLSSKNWQRTPVVAAKDFDEAFALPGPGEPGFAKDADWTPFAFTAGKDLPNLIGRDNAFAYFRGTVVSERDQSITFGVSSDDAVKVWLNGKLIHSNKASRGVDQAIDRVTGKFLKGDNQLTVKLINGISTDGLNIRLVDPEAQKVSDALAALTKSPTNPASAQTIKELYLDLNASDPKAGRYQTLKRERDQLEQSIPMSLIAQEMEKPRPTFILKRGLYDQLGDSVQRSIPAALGTMPKTAPMNRLGLAQWMVSPSNPLVARVFVNRLWQQHFGIGIVKTSEDFGSQGEWPTNQPLLDTLAIEFMKSGWSIKKLNRLIVTSAAFRQSSRITREKLLKDPENRLISRGPRYRLDAEVIRDKALFASGLLDQELGGRGFKPYQPDGIWEGTSDPASSTHFYVQDHGSQIYRRSLYMFWKRTAPPPPMITFDSPLRDTCVVRRSITNTPLQALTVMNEPSFLEASRKMAERVLSESKSNSQRLSRAFTLTMGRTPNAKEFKVLERLLAQFSKRYHSDVESSKKLLKVGESPQSKKLSPTDQASWMLICSTLMNTDEFVTLH